METLPEAGEDDEDEPVARYAGCTLCLGHGNEPVKGWEPVTIPEEMTEGWQIEYSCTVLGYLEEKCPDSLLVYESEDDPNVLHVIFAPKEATGDEDGEGKGTLYKRGGDG